MGTALQNLRTKYPQYDSIPDFELATRIVEKHPQYKDAFADVLSKPSEAKQPEQPQVNPRLGVSSDVASQMAGNVVNTAVEGVKNAVSGAWEGIAQPAEKLLSSTADMIKMGLEDVGLRKTGAGATDIGNFPKKEIESTPSTFAPKPQIMGEPNSRVAEYARKGIDVGIGAFGTFIGASIPEVNAVVGALAPHVESAGNAIGGDKGKEVANEIMKYGVAIKFGAPVVAGQFLSDVGGFLAKKGVDYTSLSDQDKQRVIELVKNVAFVSGIVGTNKFTDAMVDKSLAGIPETPQPKGQPIDIEGGQRFLAGEPQPPVENIPILPKVNVPDQFAGNFAPLNPTQEKAQGILASQEKAQTPYETKVSSLVDANGKPIENIPDPMAIKVAQEGDILNAKKSQDVPIEDVPKLNISPEQLAKQTADLPPAEVKPDFAKEAEALGAVFQGENKGRGGVVHSREYKIVNPDSPAVNANITVKEGENLADRIKAKEAEFAKPAEVKPEAPKEPVINKEKIAQDVFVTNEHLRNNKRFKGREDLIRQRNNRLERAGLRLSGGKIFDAETGKEIKQDIARPKDIVEDGIRKEELSQRELDIIDNLGEILDTGKSKAVNKAGMRDIVEDDGKELSQRAQDLINAAKQAEKSGIADVLSRSEGIRDGIPVDQVLLEKRIREAKSVDELSQIANEISGSRVPDQAKIELQDRVDAKQNEPGSKKPDFNVSGIKWIRGVGKQNEGRGDKFFSATKEVAANYTDAMGNPKYEKISPEEMPKNPLIVSDKTDLAEIIGYEGNPFAEPFDAKVKFDDVAKKYALERGHDAIVYQDGTFNEPEMHLFGKPSPKVDLSGKGNQFNAFAGQNDPAYSAKMPMGSKPLDPNAKGIDGTPLGDANKPKGDDNQGNIFAIGANVAANSLIQSLPLDDDTKKKLTIAVNALTVAGMGVAFGVALRDDAKKILSDIRGMVAKKALANGWDAETIKNETVKATDDFLKSEEAKSLSMDEIATIKDLNKSAEFKKEADNLSSEVKKAEEKEVKETIQKAKVTGVSAGVSLKSILGGGKLSRIERLNIIEKTGQENANLSDAELIKKAQEYSDKATAGVDKEDPIMQKFFDEGEKYVESINIEKLNLDKTAIKKIKVAMEQINKKFDSGELASKHTPITDEEVIAMSELVEPLSGKVSRQDVVKIAAATLKLRNVVNNMSFDPKGFSNLYIKQFDTIRPYGHLFCRALSSLKIKATGNLNTASDLKANIVNKIISGGAKIDDVIEAGKNVDFNDNRQVVEFYRKFVKPTATEILDPFRYINMLSSPLTHIVNLTGNVLSTAVFAPASRLASGFTDAVISTLTGKERTHYSSEMPAYYKGAINSLPDAWQDAMDVMSGKKMVLRPDITQIPTMGAKVDQSMYPKSYWLLNGISQFNEKAGVIIREMEANDMFFKRLVSSGLKESVANKYKKSGGKLLSPDLPEAKANVDRTSSEYLFREELDAKSVNSQGHVLNTIDKITELVLYLRKWDIGGGIRPFAWMIPFIQVGQSMLKRGIEFSPAGISTIAGNKDPIEQYGKSLIGSTVALGTLALVATHETTWSVPQDPQKKKQFYADGKIPYAMRFPEFGNVWVSINRLGIAAYPVATTIALKHGFADEQTKIQSMKNFKPVEKRGWGDKGLQVVMNMTQYYADQPYMKSVGDLMDMARGGRAIESLYKTGANVAKQYVPLSSLIGWVNGFIDTTPRNSKGLEHLYERIPFASQTIEPFKNKYGVPEKRDFTIMNQFSPVSVSKARQGSTLKLFGK